MNRDRREAEKAARRARRLAERAEERARRKERQAQRAQERAERLAERAQRRPSSERDLDRSIEDFVDDMTDKAERWIDEQTRSVFGASDEREVSRAKGEAKRARDDAQKARHSADRAGRAADDLSSLTGDGSFDGLDDDFSDLYGDGSSYEDLYGGGNDYTDGMGMFGDGYDDETGEPLSRRSERRARREARRQDRKARRQRRYGYGRDDGSFWTDFDWGNQGWYRSSRRKARKRKSAHLYKDKQRKKVFGVCAGLADYWGRPAWEIRVYAVVGLFVIPSVVVPAYVIMSLIMDDKPYFRRVTDRFDTADDSPRPSPADSKSQQAGSSRQEDSVKRRQRDPREPRMNNVQAMKAAKDKFADIEQRLREMETHVTSNRFELQREFKKIAGED